MTLAHPEIGTGFNNSTSNFLFLDFCREWECCVLDSSVDDDAALLHSMLPNPQSSMVHPRHRHRCSLLGCISRMQYCSARTVSCQTIEFFQSVNLSSLSPLGQSPVVLPFLG